MLAPIVHTPKYHPSFGKTVQFGKPGDMNPSVLQNSLWCEVAKNDSHIEDTMDELERTQNTEVIIRNIKRAHSLEGPLDPSMRKPFTATLWGDTNQIIPLESDRRKQLLQFMRNFQDELLQSTLVAFTNAIYEISSLVDKAKPNTQEFIKGIIEMNSFLASGITVNINTELNELKDIANSDEAVIFIFNHEARVLNDALMNGFMSLLYSEYKEAGKSETCPMPKLISAKNLDNSEFSDALRKLQVVEVDQSLNKTSKRAKMNQSGLTQVVKGFIKNKTNILIFPEGAKGAKKGLSNAERFQPGTGKIIEMALKRKENVKVVSIGLSSDHENSGVIHIGKPLNFSLENNKVKVSGGNFSEDKSLIEKSNYYNLLAKTDKDNPIPIYNGKDAVKMGDPLLNRFISGILSCDLPICANKAKADFQKILDEEPIQGITNEEADSFH